MKGNGDDDDGDVYMKRVPEMFKGDFVGCSPLNFYQGTDFDTSLNNMPIEIVARIFDMIHITSLFSFLTMNRNLREWAVLSMKKVKHIHVTEKEEKRSGATGFFPNQFAFGTTRIHQKNVIELCSEPDFTRQFWNALRYFEGLEVLHIESRSLDPNLELPEVIHRTIYLNFAEQIVLDNRETLKELTIGYGENIRFPIAAIAANLVFPKLEKLDVHFFYKGAEKLLPALKFLRIASRRTLTLEQKQCDLAMYADTSSDEEDEHTESRLGGSHIQFLKPSFISANNIEIGSEVELQSEKVEFVYRDSSGAATVITAEKYRDENHDEGEEAGDEEGGVDEEGADGGGEQVEADEEDNDIESESEEDESEDDEVDDEEVAALRKIYPSANKDDLFELRIPRVRAAYDALKRLSRADKKRGKKWEKYNDYWTPGYCSNTLSEIPNPDQLLALHLSFKIDRMLALRVGRFVNLTYLHLYARNNHLRLVIDKINSLKSVKLLISDDTDFDDFIGNLCSRHPDLIRVEVTGNACMMTNASLRHLASLKKLFDFHLRAGDCTHVTTSGFLDLFRSACRDRLRVKLHEYYVSSRRHLLRQIDYKQIKAESDLMEDEVSPARRYQQASDELGEIAFCIIERVKEDEPSRTQKSSEA